MLRRTEGFKELKRDGGKRTSSTENRLKLNRQRWEFASNPPTSYQFRSCSFSPHPLLCSVPKQFLALFTHHRSTTLIILCSIENHHKKINSFFHTLLVLVLFSRDDRSFHAGNFAIHFRLSWEIFFLLLLLEGERIEQKSEAKRPTHGALRWFFYFFFFTSLTRLVNRALIRFEKPKMLTI
jgi:hypothetical protein